MSVRNAFFAVLVVACAVSTTLAQRQPTSQTRKPPSLIQQLEKVRDALIGPPVPDAAEYNQPGRQYYESLQSRAGSALSPQTRAPVHTAQRPRTSSNRPESLESIPTDEYRTPKSRSKFGIQKPASAMSKYHGSSSRDASSSESTRSGQSRGLLTPNATDEAVKESRTLASGSRYRPSAKSTSAPATGNSSNHETGSPRVAVKHSPTLAAPSSTSRLRDTRVERATRVDSFGSRATSSKSGHENPYVNTESVRTARAPEHTPKLSVGTTSSTRSSSRPAAADLARSINESSKTSGAAANRASEQEVGDKLSVSNTTSAATTVEIPRPETARRSVVQRPKKTPKTDDGDEMLFTRHTPKLVVETAGPRQINVGRTAVYKVRVTNEGSAEVENTVVSVDVPSWADIVGVDTTTGDTHLPTSVTDTGISWQIDRVAPDSNEMMTLRLVPRESRTFDLAVRYTVSPPASETLVEVQEPKLAMSMSGPSDVFYGEEIVYKLTVSNPGSGDAENVVVRLLPSADSDTATAQHTLGTIPAGESRVLELELNARQAGKMLIHAECSAEGGLAANVREDVLVRRADLDVEMTGPNFQYAGTETTFKVRVMNPGNATAENVEVTTVLPPGTKYIASSGGGQFNDDKAAVSWKLSSLQPGADHVFELKCQPGMSGVNRHEVVVTAADGLRDATVLSTEVEALADLELNVKDPKGPVPVDQQTEYKVMIRNRGAEAATGVEAVAYFSEGIEPISVDGGAGHQILPGQVVFDVIPTIGAGQEVTMTITAQASVPGNHDFRVELRCDSLDTHLAAQETTRFFADTQRLGGKPSNASGLTGAQRVPLQPIPDADNADYDNADYEDSGYDDGDVTPAEHSDGE